MKFARYLQETQTPEWKKAYIDYRGLKKRLTAIRRRQEGIDQENANTSPDDIVESPRSSFSISDPVPAAPASLKRLDSGSTIQSLHKPLSFENNGNPSSRPPPSTTGPAPPTSSRSRFMKLNRRTSLFRGNARNPFPANLTLQEAKASLSSQEQAFVDALDAELDKIDSFYLTRMREMEQRQQLLTEQLTELAYHKELYSDWKHKTRGIETFLGIPKTSKLPKQKERAKDQNFAANSARFGNLDPEDYANAKKKLKKAVTEHYRVLEMLHNYRVLNLTGFRKALKKFEKTTKIPLMNPYMTECVERAPFAIDRAVKGMMSEVESVFVLQFTGGNRKAAMKNLRGGLAHQTFHFETTTAGLMIGMGIPAFVAGIYLSFREDVRDDYPGWGALLYIYGILFVPVLFSLLVATNLIVWSNSRVNYVFIFELEPRTRLDYRQYAVLPSFLFLTLCYSFFLSFLRAGEDGGMLPQYWALVWLGIAAVLVLDPFPIMSKHSRSWLVKRINRLLMPGFTRVEFADFWMGDQFCSLVFTLSNLPLLVCTYAKGFDPGWHGECGNKAAIWPAAFVLAQLPLFIRFVQSVRRYADSGLNTHLINGGKYASGIVSYLFYYLWRHHGGRGTLFALWILFNTIYALYAGTWDLLMDWSLMKPRAKHRFLRDDLLYTNYVWLYYVTIVMNVILRFAWVIYIPALGPDNYLRSFIVGTIEVCRRVLWNFYRLENEHLGNVDQYRVTREVPLPYSLEESREMSDDEDEEDKRSAKASK